MLVPSPVIQVQFQNAMPLAAEDFNPLLKDMNKVLQEIVACSYKFSKEKSFLPDHAQIRCV